MDVVQVLPVELVEDAISRLRIGQSFEGLLLLHLLENPSCLNSEIANRAEK
jgi:hypothetical protein